MIEIWKPIENYAGYEVSNMGNVRSWKVMGSKDKIRDVPILLTQSIGNWGHRKVGLTVKNKVKFFPIQRLVAFHFIGKPRDPSLVVDHKDNNPSNNCVDNLEYKTSIENILRGNAPPAINKRKTHCIRKHSLEGKNIRIEKTGYRKCIACIRIRNAKKVERNKYEAMCESFQEDIKNLIKNRDNGSEMSWAIDIARDHLFKYQKLIGGRGC